MNVKEFTKATGIKICTDHTGKMKGLWSLSTSPILNPYCNARAEQAGSVCSHCYSMRMNKMYHALNNVLIKNSELLMKRVLEDDEIPTITEVKYFRFESFGDIANIFQAINYIKIAHFNPQVSFALWTKNPVIMRNALAVSGGKPDNLRIVLSSSRLNSPIDASRWSFVDSVFTVYDKKYIADNGVTINCGARSCLGCHRCYDGNEFYINEKLK